MWFEGLAGRDFFFFLLDLVFGSCFVVLLAWCCLIGVLVFFVCLFYWGSCVFCFVLVLLVF